MKKKKKHAIARAIKEFRYHTIIVVMENGKIKKIRHPTFVFIEKGNIYIYVPITHSSKVMNLITVELRKNPNPKDSRKSYRIKEFRSDTKDRFGRKQKDWSINCEDEKDIRNEYKKR